jgi:hypothetical protein
MFDFLSKLYDGRGVRVKWLIPLRELKRINKLDRAEVMPIESRAKWYQIWVWWFCACLMFCVPNAIIITLIQFFTVHRGFDLSEYVDMFLGVSFTGFFLASLVTVFTHRTTWASRQVALDTLVQLGYCPHCGYIIRDSPTQEDGCVLCAECGHAWRIDPDAG